MRNRFAQHLRGVIAAGLRLGRQVGQRLGILGWPAVLPLSSDWLDLIASMRAFAALGGIGFFPVHTRSRGAVPIWIDDINAAKTDANIFRLILKLTSNDEQQKVNHG